MSNGVYFEGKFPLKSWAMKLFMCNFSMEQIAQKFRDDNCDDLKRMFKDEELVYMLWSYFVEEGIIEPTCKI